MNLAVPLAKDVLPKLATKATLSIFDKFKKRISGRQATRTGKGINLFILHENKDELKS